MKEISINEKYELFKETINSCGMFLLKCDEDEIEYRLFEEFDSGRISFLHNDIIDKLLEANLISKNIYDKSIQLREMFGALENTKLWNVQLVKSAEEWKQILLIADEINKMINNLSI